MPQSPHASKREVVAAKTILAQCIDNVNAQHQQLLSVDAARVADSQRLDQRLTALEVVNQRALLGRLRWLLLGR